MSERVATAGRGLRLPRGLGFDRFSGFYLWAAFIVLFTVWQPRLFPTTATLHSVAADRAIAAMLGLAVLVPLICGVYDLAVGATANLTTIIAVMLVTQGWSLPVVIVASVLVGTVIGAVNGFVVVRLKVNSFITTLGMASIITATQIIVTNNLQPLPPSNLQWSALTQSTFLGFQVVVVYLLVVAVLLWWVLAHTPVGRYLYAIGANPEAARLSGVRVGHYTWMSLIASGSIAGVAGVLYASLAGPSLTYGPGLLLPAFAAVFLGSTQIIPGRFNVWGSVLAIYVLATGVKGLQLVTDVQWLDPMFSGVALIAAVAVAVGRQRSGAERTRRRQSDPQAGPPPTDEPPLAAHPPAETAAPQTVPS